jgi:hypothetical protein
MRNSPRTVSPGWVIVARLLLSLVLAAVGPLTVASDEHTGEEPGHTSHEAHLPKGLHEVLIFGGATDDRGEWADTWGAEYGYGFMDNYTVGVFFDRAEGQLRSSVVGLALWANVAKGFSVMFGPALEFLDEAHEEEGDHGSHAEEGSKRQFLARIGVGYSVHVGKRYTLMPVVHADFVEKRVIWVTGLNFGIRFGKTVH